MILWFYSLMFTSFDKINLNAFGMQKNYMFLGFIPLMEKCQNVFYIVHEILDLMNEVHLFIYFLMK